MRSPGRNETGNHIVARAAGHRQRAARELRPTSRAFGRGAVTHESREARAGVPDPALGEDLAVDRAPELLEAERFFEEKIGAACDHFLASAAADGHRDHLHLPEGLGISDESNGDIALEVTIFQGVVDHDDVGHVGRREDQAVLGGRGGADLEAELRIPKGVFHQFPNERIVLDHEDLLSDARPHARDFAAFFFEESNDLASRDQVVARARGPLHAPDGAATESEVDGLRCKVKETGELPDLKELLFVQWGMKVQDHLLPRIPVHWKAIKGAGPVVTVWKESVIDVFNILLTLDVYLYRLCTSRLAGGKRLG